MSKMDKILRYLDIYCLVFWFLETVYTSICIISGNTRYDLLHVIAFLTLTIVQIRVCLLEGYFDGLFGWK